MPSPVRARLHAGRPNGNTAGPPSENWSQKGLTESISLMENTPVHKGPMILGGLGRSKSRRSIGKTSYPRSTTTASQRVICYFLESNVRIRRPFSLRHENKAFTAFKSHELAFAQN